MTAVETTDIRPGYTISRVLKGGWQLAGGHAAVDHEKAIAEMGDYIRSGITTFDCADIYTGVEQLIGDFRRATIASGDRELLAPLKVHTKSVPDLQKLRTITKAELQETIDRSLVRLGLDRLNLVQFHWWDTAVPRYVEVAGWLADFQKEGKIDLLGTTNFNTSCMRELKDSGIEFASMQVQYSLLDNRPEKDLLPFCKENDIKILCYGTVAGGFLSDRWLSVPEPVGELENRSLVKYKLIIDDMGGWELFQTLLSTLRKIADRHHVNIADVAMRAVLDWPQVAGIIVGVRHGGHLEAHSRLFGLTLTDADRAEIDAVLAQKTTMEGDVYDLERDQKGRHGRIMHYNLNEDKPAA
ncbi:aldo/keto reductase [Oryzicola mucosus]|uniref:Aldo/keto reductase n=1 Tax=Oryzicola mucosus TaxID=2767425 RepID=A0A8J6Q3U1_9HYPH|nr:aldo/keto reductase [Oryzicola mucosus]